MGGQRGSPEAWRMDKEKYTDLHRPLRPLTPNLFTSLSRAGSSLAEWGGGGMAWGGDGLGGGWPGGGMAWGGDGLGGGGGGGGWGVRGVGG